MMRLPGAILSVLTMFWFAGMAGAQSRGFAKTSVPVDPSTLTGKVMCGYQGWFAVPTDAINRGWYHYQLNGYFQPGQCKIDLWPDVSEFDSDEKYATSFRTADGSVACVFSSQNRKTVARHFRWMQEYGIDGVFIQRFASEVRGAGLAQFDTVLSNCRAGASQYGRSFAIMYDLSGLQTGQMSSVVNDWKNLMHRGVTVDPMYQHHQGKPVVAVWGIGFNDGRNYTLAECETLIDFLRNDPIYGGNTVMVGVPTYWRTLDQDAVADSALHRIILKADIVSPWAVGRYSTLDGITLHAHTTLAGDLQWCNTRAKEYLPVVFPGFSWHNMKPASPLNAIPRQQGNFLWHQYYEVLGAGATMVYQAMFDEIDEGTAIFKCTNDPPVGLSSFVTYEGLPTDTYLWMVGEGTRMLRKEISLTDTIPLRVPNDVAEPRSGKPEGINLLPNYPNPFNPSTTLEYSIPRDSFVELSAYDVRGCRVATLVRERKAAGSHAFVWNGLGDDGSSLPSGVYLIRLDADGVRSARKAVLMK